MKLTPEGVYTAFWSALLLSGFLSKPILKILIRIKAQQTISTYLGESHQKKQGTPTMGGWIQLAGFFGAYALMKFLGFDLSWSPMILGVGYGLIGFIDDYITPSLKKGSRGLSWKNKIGLEFLVGVIAIGYHLEVHLGGWNLLNNESWIMCGIMSFFLLGFVNAYNFVDGLDGLAGGILIILCAGLIMISSLYGSQDAYLRVWYLCSLLIGCTLPFLYWNAPPARVFMGDTGALAIGGILGFAFFECLLLAVPFKQWGIGDHMRPFWILLGALTVMSLILLIELLSVPLQVFSVKVRKKRLPIRTPIHHTFEMWGWPETRIVWTFIIAQMVLVVLACHIVVVI